MRSSIIGFGEVGAGLFAVLKNHYEVKWFEKDSDPNYCCEIMHICIPWSETFVSTVKQYADIQQPTYIVNHSTVPVGTTEQLYSLVKVPCFHSPIQGQHPDMAKGILSYVKYIGYWRADPVIVEQVCAYFEKAGIKTKAVVGTKTAELAKLLSLARYGMNIAFAKEQEEICKHFGVDYKVAVNDYEAERTIGLKSIGKGDLAQPILYPFKNYVGGHCVIENMSVLLEQKETPMMKMARDIGKNTVVWQNCNIYKSAKIGKGCSIGMGTEIGNKVVIGNNVRIGAMCFIPEGVTIHDNVFIAPGVFFSNDKHPPSNHTCWGKTEIQKGAAIGMGSVILPGVRIGENAIVGAGSVVTKDVPSGEKWYGMAAMPHGKRIE